MNENEILGVAIHRAFGKFTVIDGGECAGKGGIMTALQRILPPDKVVFTREPGGTEAGEELREFLFARKRKFDDWETALLMNVSRSVHLREKILPALAAGRHVICDRFHMSTFAYQGGAGVFGALWRVDPYMLGKRFIGDRWTSARCPDLGIFIDVSPGVELARQLSRNEKEKNSFDSESLPEITARYNRYRQIIRDIKNHHVYPVVVVDGNRDEKVVRREVVKLVCGAIGHTLPPDEM